MRVHRASLRVAVLALLAMPTLAAGVSFAQAPAPKSPDVQTIGGVTSIVTTTPVDLTAATSFVPPPVSALPVPVAQPPKGIPVVVAPPPSPAKESAVLPHVPNLADVFGRIPRLEWTTGEVVKPADIVTIGPATFEEAAARAAAPAARSAVSPARAKPAEKTTSLPRDPAAPAPAPAPGKTAGQEVKR